MAVLGILCKIMSRGSITGGVDDSAVNNGRSGIALHVGYCANLACSFRYLKRLSEKLSDKQ